MARKVDTLDFPPMKDIYAQLVNKGTGTPIRGMNPSLVQLAEFPTTVGRLQIAVYEQCNHEVGHVIAGRLDIWHPDTLDGDSLNPWEVIADPSKVYVVEVPPPPSPESTSSAELMVKWTRANDRPRLAVTANDRVIELSETLLEGTGVDHASGKPLTLYCRRAFRGLWDALSRYSIENEGITWLVGPPGTGKTCTAMAFANTLDSALWDVMWIGFNREDEALNCVCLRGDDKVACVVKVTQLNLLKQVLDSTSTVKHTILFLDGYAWSNEYLEHARVLCKEWHCENKSLHRLVYVCSMAEVNKHFHPDIYRIISSASRDVEMEATEKTKSSVLQRPVRTENLYRLDSWAFQDYEEAIKDDAFFENVKDMFEPLRESADRAVEKRRVLEEKYCIAGGSAILMFDVPTDTARDILDEAMHQISDFGPMQVGAPTTSNISKLQAEYYRPGRDYEMRFVSDYVARRLAILKGPDVLQRTSILCGVNPAMDGYLFEAWFFAMLKASDLHWYYVDRFFGLHRAEWKRADTILFDPSKAFTGISLDKPTWLAPVKWNEAGYDAVFVNKAKKVIQIVQITSAEQHIYDHDYFIRLLVKLAAHADLNGVFFKRVELLYVVPMERLRTFRCPVTSRDFLRGVVEHVSTSSAPVAQTQSLQFRKCNVRVVAVDYKRSMHARTQRMKNRNPSFFDC